jgi:hypothetical protein
LILKNLRRKNPRTAGLSSTTTFITLPPIKSASQGCKADAEYDDDNRRDTDYKAVGKKTRRYQPKAKRDRCFSSFPVAVHFHHSSASFGHNLRTALLLL